MEVGGWFLVVAAAGWLALKLHVSFVTEGGAIGMVPDLDGALFPPALGWLGLWLALDVSGRAELPDWVFWLGWLGTVPVAGWLLIYAGRLGERAHRAARGTP